MKLVEKHTISKSNRLYKEVDKLCFLSKNLYNAGLYRIRQNFFNTRELLNYESLQKELQSEKQPDYYALPTKVSQQILRTLCNNMKSFMAACKEYQKEPEKFKARPKIPKYKHKTKGRNITIYPIDAISAPLLRENKVHLSLSNITIPSKQKNIQQVRIVPCSNIYKIEIVYEKCDVLLEPDDITINFVQRLQVNTPISQYLLEEFPKALQQKIKSLDAGTSLSQTLKKALVSKLNSLLKQKLYNKDAFKKVKLPQSVQKLSQKKLKEDDLIYFNRNLLNIAFPDTIPACPSPPSSKVDNKKIAGIDIGLDNLAAITSNLKDFQPVLINGRPLKSINQYFNKKRAILMSYIGDKGSSQRLEKLTHKRNCIVDNYLHQSSRFIINLCIKHQIGTIVIGKNEHWKNSINLGKKNNQNFVSIPHARFIEQLQYKGKLAGIDVVLNEESYTSKCSFLDLESIEKHEKYQGRRIKRGLFRSYHGHIINADINASLNIIRKVIPKAFANGI